MNTAGSLNHTITTTNQDDLETNTLYRRDIFDVIFNSINNNRMSNVCLNTFIMNSLNSSSLSLNRNTISLNNHNNSNINQFYSNLMPYLFPMDLSLNSVQQQQQNQQLQYYTNDWLTSNNNNSNNNVYNLTLMYFALATQCILRHLCTTTQQSQQNLCSNSSAHSNCTPTLSTISTTSQNDLSSQSNENFSESHTKLSTIHKYIKLDTIKLNGNTRIKRYQCNYPNCTKAYYKRSHLNEHYHLHTGVKPHLCNQPGCGARFTRADQLSRHRRAHTGERNFYCNVCLKRFKRSDHLKVHLTRNVCTKSNL